MPPAYVKPYVKRQKNDTTDAEAICEAVTRPNMRFVPTKTVEQQGGLMLHRARHLFIRQQTAVINSIRAYLAEFGIVAPVGRRGVEQLLEVVANTADRRLPEVARACLAALGSQLRALKAQILEFDRRIIVWHRSSATSKRLDAIPGVGPALATALVASVADPKVFRSGRDFSAWVGLVPKQNSSGGKDKLGSISKQGDRYLRSLFTAGALAVIRYAKIHGTGHRPWLTALLTRRPTKVAAIALRRIGPVPGPIIAGIDPQPAGLGAAPAWHCSEKQAAMRFGPIEPCDQKASRISEPLKAQRVL
jgi:transposase